MTTRTQLAGLALATTFVAATASAQTVAYWRFEGDASTRLLDSSGNNHTLTAQNTSGIAYAAIPESGNGSGFLNPVGAALLPNAQFVAKTGTDNSTGGRFLAADSTAFTMNSLTLEMMLNVTGHNALSFLAGHFNGSNNQRSYALSLDANRELQFILSGNGTATEFVMSGITLALNTDYYLGVSMDLTSPTQAERTVTFFIQDLTAGTALQSISLTNIATASVHNSTTSFAIGSQGGGGSAGSFQGLIDEVRLSQGVLSANQLLVAIPEPSAFAALAGLGALGLAASRRRRR